MFDDELMDLGDMNSEVATESDAVREYVRNYGAENPNMAWIVSQYDTVEANPFYEGPPVPHPDEEGS